MSRFSFVIGCLCGLAVSCSSMAAGVPLTGVGTHVIGLARDIQLDQLEMAKGVGFNSVRADVPWRYVEQTPGVLAIPGAWDRFVDEALARGIRPVLILDYGNPFYDGGDKPRSSEAIAAYRRYAELVVAHFRKRVGIYEIWNEWDNHTGGFPAGTPAEYAALFKSVYPALKRADPEATILVGSGVQQGWNEKLAELGVVALGDGLSVHPYNYQRDLPDAPEVVAASVLDIEGRVARVSGKKSVPIYVTEIGWPTNVGRFGHDEDEVASFAFRTTTLLNSLPFVRGVWWYELIDGGDDSFNKENRFGLVRRDKSQKPAYRALQAAIELLKDGRPVLGPSSRLADGFISIEVTGGSSGGALEWMAALAPWAPQVHCRETGASRQEGADMTSSSLKELETKLIRDGSLCTSSRPDVH